MAGRADSSGLVDADPDVALLADLRLARMQTHADEELDIVGPRMRRQIALRVGGRRDGVLRAAEGDEEGVALGVDLVSTMGRERRSQDPLVLCEHASVLLPEPLQEGRRAFDVGEQEGDSAARELAAHEKSLGARGEPPRSPARGRRGWELRELVH